MTIEEFVTKYSEEPVLTADGFDAAFLGIAEVNGTMVAVYDECDVIDILRKDGMSGSEAREYFDFNVAAAYVGEKTPIYLNRFPKQKVDN